MYPTGNLKNQIFRQSGRHTHPLTRALLAQGSCLVVPGELDCRLERSLLIAADVPTDEGLGRVAISTRGLLVQLPRVRHGVQPPDADLVLRDPEVDVDVLNVLNPCGAHRSCSNFLGRCIPQAV